MNETNETPAVQAEDQETQYLTPGTLRRLAEEAAPQLDRCLGRILRRERYTP